jgi:hypothetical protein
MSQLTDKSNDRFQLAYAINSGVLGHVETVVLMSRV